MSVRSVRMPLTSLSRSSILRSCSRSLAICGLRTAWNSAHRSTMPLFCSTLSRMAWLVRLMVSTSAHMASLLSLMTMPPVPKFAMLRLAGTCLNSMVSSPHLAVMSTTISCPMLGMNVPVWNLGDGALTAVTSATLSRMSPPFSRI